MNVLYTCDDNYSWIMGISMISLFENNRAIRELTVYLIGDEICDGNRQLLNQISEQYNRDINIIDAPRLDIPETLVSARWPISAFTRLFAGLLLPQTIHKVLYLDCDTIICDSIKEIETYEFSDNVVFGVKDCISAIYKRNIGLEKESIYINAGVIYMDLDSIRKIDIKKEIDIYMSDHEKLINYADQDILNGIFRGKIREMPLRYDVMTIGAVHTYEEVIRLRKPTCYYTKREFDEAVENPAIIHYTTNMLVVRPWFSNANHPLTYMFKRYMDRSPWRRKKLDSMVFQSRESWVISFFDKFPKKISYSILGWIHSELKPRFIRIRAK